LVCLLNEVGSQGHVCLFAVPGTAIRGTQPRLKLHQFLKPFASGAAPLLEWPLRALLGVLWLCTFCLFRHFVGEFPKTRATPLKCGPLFYKPSASNSATKPMLKYCVYQTK